MSAIDNLEELRTFVLVVETGSLSAAARRLQVSPNAVSRRMMRIESNLGVKLLRRSTRAASVTHEGRVLYERARCSLDELDAAEAELRGRGDELQGLIRVAVPGGSCSVAVLAALGRLLTLHPSLRLQLLVTNQGVDPIGAGFDIALHVGPLRDSRLVSRRLARASWLLAAAPSYLASREPPRAPQDLLTHQCLRLASAVPQNQWRLVDEQGGLHVVDVAGNFESDDSRALADATYAGIGIGIRPERELDEAAARGTLVRVLPGFRFEAMDVHAVMSPGAAKLPRVATFLDVLHEVFEAVL